MKITAIILLFACLTASAAGFSQITLSEKNVSLASVFKKIQQQSGYEFLYPSDLITKTGNVSVEVKNVTLDDAIKASLSGTQLTYIISDKTVVIKEGVVKVTTEQKPLLAPIDIHGRIVNEDGDPVEGASIKIKGSNNGTTTNYNGEFLLKNVEENATLIFTGINIETFEIKVKGKTDIGTFSAKTKVASLNEVTVNQGYYTRKQRENTGNVAVVSGKDIQKQPVSDPLQTLEGRVAGLQVTQASGVPGANSTIRIRGQNTIAIGKPVGANTPLFIVDGVPFNSQTLSSPFINSGIVTPGGIANTEGSGLSPFNSINPADIESIEVLKDADATAIYGSLGANGVIIITTKKGRPGKLKAQVNMASGFSKPSRYYQLLNTKQYIGMRLEAFKNDGGLGLLIPQNARSFPDLLIWDTTRYTDWQKFFIGNAASFANGSVGISGGNANSQFLASIGLTNLGTTMPGDYKDRRISFHLSQSNTSADKRFESQLLLNYSNDNNRLPGINPVSYITLPPVAPAIYDAGGNLNWQLYGGSPSWNNPLAYTKGYDESVTDYYGADLNLSYHLLKGLKISTNLGYSRAEMNQTNIGRSSGSPPTLSNNPDARVGSFSTSNARTWSIEPQVAYTIVIGKGRFDVLAGVAFKSQASDSKGLIGIGFPSDALISNIQAASSVIIQGSTEASYHYNAVYGRLGYTLLDKYLSNITARRDGSSRFGPEKQFGNFGAVGAGWIFSKEKWFADRFSIVSFGKLRGSYGITGNDGAYDYQFLSTYSPTGVSYQNTAGLMPTGLSNPDLRWEEVRKLEAGLELGFLKDRFNLGISWYRDRTGNQLVTFPLPNITGFGGIVANLPALIQNTGWEFVLNTSNVNGKNFKWHTTGNLAINRNKLISFPGLEKTGYASTYFVGQPLGLLRKWHFTGVDPQTGLYMFATKNGTGIPVSSSNPAADDRTIFKSLFPSFFGGIENSFTYKNIQLDFFIQFQKQLGVNYINSFGIPGSQGNEPLEVLDRWQHPGDLTSVQRFSRGIAPYVTAYNNYALTSDGDITDASFIRLKSLSVSYNLPASWQKHVHFAGSRIYLQCQNIFTLTKYRGLDPETPGLTMPLMRTITGGVQFSF